MPPKKEYWEFIKEEEQFLKYFNEENKRLVVLDIHPQWSGACELMFPTYKTLGTQIDDFEKRMTFLLMDYEVIAGTTAFKIDKFACTCIPKFMFIIEGKIVDQVVGSNIPELVEKISKHIPLISS